MTTTVRYSVWVEVDRLGDEAAFNAIYSAFDAIPGFLESSWEDSYES